MDFATKFTLQLKNETQDIDLNKLSSFNQQLLLTGDDNHCLRLECNGGLAPVYTREQYLKQLLFFEDLFELKSPLYVGTSGGLPNDIHYDFEPLKDMVKNFMKNSGAAEIKHVAQVVE